MSKNKLQFGFDSSAHIAVLLLVGGSKLFIERISLGLLFHLDEDELVQDLTIGMSSERDVQDVRNFVHYWKIQAALCEKAEWGTPRREGLSFSPSFNDDNDWAPWRAEPVEFSHKGSLEHRRFDLYAYQDAYTDEYFVQLDYRDGSDKKVIFCATKEKWEAEIARFREYANPEAPQAEMIRLVFSEGWGFNTPVLRWDADMFDEHRPLLIGEAERAVQLYSENSERFYQYVEDLKNSSL